MDLSHFFAKRSMHAYRLNGVKRVGTLLSLLSALTGCATWKVDKSVTAADADVAFIQKEIQLVREFQQSVYDVSTFAVERCHSKTLREPFTLMTLGHLANAYPKEKIAAYWRAEGFDETFKVLWATDDSPLQPGERVIEINGRKIENNKTGMGEFPLVKYLNYTIKARAAAHEDGKPYVVKTERDKELAVPLKLACRVKVWAMPIFEESDYSELPLDRHSAVVLPTNAIRAARSVDEHRYLAGLAVYYSASEEAHQRQAGRSGVLGVGMAAIIAMPLLYPVMSPLAMLAGNAVATKGMLLDAAKFSSKVLNDMDGNPYAGLDLMSRLDAEKLGATRVLLSVDEREELRQFIKGELMPAEGTVVESELFR